jgi:4'-phosphopantetheinyl transferase
VDDQILANCIPGRGGPAIHVWPIRLEAGKDVLAGFQRVLAPDETARAARFSFDHLQRRFVLARGALRILLGYYLRTGAHRIQFSYGWKGKPRLATPGIDFNASRSGTVALLAFTLQCEIGVDIEQIRPLCDIQEIANRFFCAEESAELRALPVSEREHAFFVCWTRKEAYLKAVGDGLSAPLDGFRVALRPGQPARLIQSADGMSADKAWTLHDLNVTPHHAAALAYNDSPRPVYVLPLTEPAELLDLK